MEFANSLSIVKGRLQMRKIVGAAAVAVIVAAVAVIWSKSMALKSEAAALAAKAEAASSAGNIHSRYETSDRKYGWGPFRLVDW